MNNSKKHPKIQNKNHNKITLNKLCPVKIAEAPDYVIKETIRQGELHVNIQIDNIRSLDNRAISLLKNLGIIITAIGSVGVLNRENLLKLVEPSTLLIFIIFVGGLTVSSMFQCLQIIQSTPISPTGNAPNNLLVDVSQNYSYHEQLLEYALSLSRRIIKNEFKITKSGKKLRFASVSSFCTFLLIIVFFGYLATR